MFTTRTHWDDDKEINGEWQGKTSKKGLVKIMIKNFPKGMKQIVKYYQ